MEDMAVEAAEAGATGLALFLPPASLLALVLGKIERNRQRRQRELLQATHEKLEQVRERVDHDFVESDDFEELVEEVIEKGQRRKELEKRDYYVAVVANSALPDHPDPSDIHRMIDTLERLRVSHLWLLGALLTAKSPEADPGDYLPSSFETEFAKVVSPERLRVIRDDWRDLEAHGLVTAFPSGTLSSAGARNFRSHVTELGRRFPPNS